MSERPHHRRPATFKLDDPGVIVMDPDDSSRPSRGTVHVRPEADPPLLPVPLEAPLLPVQRGFRWGAVFWSAPGGLVTLGLGLGVTRLIEDLFARSESLGYLGLAFAIAAALALVDRHRARGAWAGAAWRQSKNCTCAPAPCSPATIAPKAAPSSRICWGLRIRTRIWRGRAPRCRAMPTTSSTAPT